MSATQFKLKEYNNSIYDVNDIYEVLAAGRTYDNGGFLMKEDFGPVRTIYIERAYAQDFDRYFGSSRAWATAHMINSIASNQKKGRGPMNSVYRALGFFTENINKLEDIVRGSCSSEALLTAQKNMINFANRKPAIIGRFTTNKKPQNSYPKNGSSAPKFSKTYHAEKEQAERNIRDFHSNENAQKISGKQKQIQAEVAARNAPRNARTTPARQPVQTSPPGVNPAVINRAQQMEKFQSSQAEMAKISQAHAATIGKALKKYQSEMKSAKTSEERLLIQQEFQKLQMETKQQMQEKMREHFGQ